MNTNDSQFAATAGSCSLRIATPEESSVNRLTLSSTAGTYLRLPVRANFVPQPDITAYELAQALPLFFGQPMFQEEFDRLGASQRHWQVSPAK